MALFVERRLNSVTQRLLRAREDLAIANEQLDQLVDEADDAMLRSVVSDDKFAPLESNDAVRHRDALMRQRQSLVDTIAKLETRQDELLDAFQERRGSGA